MLKRKGFTLIEVLVVLLIMTMVMSLTSLLLTEILQFRTRSNEIHAIKEQQRFALLQIEEDLRRAADVDMPKSEGSSFFQYDRLVILEQNAKVFSPDNQEQARTVYGLKPDTTPNNNLTGYPQSNMVLFKRLMSTHSSGQSDPVAMYFNAPSANADESGMVVSYFDQEMVPCGVGVTVAYVQVRFNGTTSDGEVISTTGTFPLTTKFWYKGW